MNPRFIYDGLVIAVEMEKFSTKNAKKIVKWLMKFSDMPSSGDNTPKFFALKYLKLFNVVLAQGMF